MPDVGNKKKENDKQNGVIGTAPLSTGAWRFKVHGFCFTTLYRVHFLYLLAWHFSEFAFQLLFKRHRKKQQQAVCLRSQLQPSVNLMTLKDNTWSDKEAERQAAARLL